MYFGLPEAMRDDEDLRQAYYAGIRLVAEYLRLEEGGPWENYLKTDFEEAWTERSAPYGGPVVRDVV